MITFEDWIEKCEAGIKAGRLDPQDAAKAFEALRQVANMGETRWHIESELAERIVGIIEWSINRKE